VANRNAFRLFNGVNLAFSTVNCLGFGFFFFFEIGSLFFSTLNVLKILGHTVWKLFLENGKNYLNLGTMGVVKLLVKLLFLFCLWMTYTGDL